MSLATMQEIIALPEMAPHRFSLTWKADCLIARKLFLTCSAIELDIFHHNLTTIFLQTVEDDLSAKEQFFASAQKAKLEIYKQDGVAFLTKHMLLTLKGGSIKLDAMESGMLYNTFLFGYHDCTE